MKRNLAIVICALFAATLISVAILLAQVVSSLLIVLAIVVLLAVFGVGAGILITTNTRPSWPNDPYGQTTDDLLRPPLLRTEERRVQAGTIDNRSVTQRLSDILEEESLKHPPSDKTPAWRIERADDTPEEAREP